MEIKRYSDINTWDDKSLNSINMVEDLFVEFSDNDYSVRVNTLSTKDNYKIYISKEGECDVPNSNFSSEEIFNMIENVGEYKTKELLENITNKVNSFGYKITYQINYDFVLYEYGIDITIIIQKDI